MPIFRVIGVHWLYTKGRKIRERRTEGSLVLFFFSSFKAVPGEWFTELETLEMSQQRSKDLLSCRKQNHCLKYITGSLWWGEVWSPHRASWWAWEGETLYGVRRERLFPVRSHGEKIKNSLSVWGILCGFDEKGQNHGSGQLYVGKN